jgi:hypothetical protein
MPAVANSSASNPMSRAMRGMSPKATAPLRTAVKKEYVLTANCMANSSYKRFMPL